MFGISEIAIFIVLAVLVFGARKLPELARSLGKSARILKSEARALKTDDVAPAGPAGPGAGAADPRVIKGTVTERTEQH
ncbi:twin-arginine translocase TatA/TatE family subunit [Streptomyces sp. NPDC005794]|uniref:twin-arginine translocase TatA/TatE family subunit n=1 Tax=Streptomyces sp. NPDC005794 TaxID=3364733 RepID=UPI0036C89C66